MTSDRKQGPGRAPELREASRKHREGTVEERDTSGRAQCQDRQESISMQSRWYVQRLWRLSLMLKVKGRANPGNPAPSPGPSSRASLPFPEAQESLSLWL